jgi:hypothetical protein
MEGPMADAARWTIEDMPRWQQQIIRRTARREGMTVAQFVWEIFLIGWWLQNDTAEDVPEATSIDANPPSVPA